MDRKTARKKAEELVAHMTLEEKASQLKYDAPAIPRLGIPDYNWWSKPCTGCNAQAQQQCFRRLSGWLRCSIRNSYVKLPA